MCEGRESCIYYVTFKKQLAHRRLPKQLDLFCSVLKQKDIGLMKYKYETIQPANFKSFDIFPLFKNILRLPHGWYILLM